MVSEPQKLFRGVLSPIEALPPEIIGHIVEFSVASTNVQPEDSHQVLRLSHVSAKWRIITLSHSRLFDRADWTHWAPELLQRWCERAKYHSLSIRLEGEIMHALSTTIEHEQIPRQDNHSLPDMHRGTLLLKALRQAIPHAKTLDVEAYNHSRDALHVLRKLLAEEMPLMWALEIDLPDEHLGPEDAPLTIICPNLRWLSVSGVHIHSPAPISTINTLKFCNIYTDNEEMRWPTLYGNILTICPAIRELSLRFSSEGLIIGNNISLPHVQKLSILQGGYHVDTVPQVTSILNLFQLPSLEELTLETYRIPLQYYDRMLLALPHSISHLRLRWISLHQAYSLPLNTISGLIARPGATLSLPNLRHLECSLERSSTNDRSHELNALSMPHLQIEIEQVLIKMIKERKLAVIHLPIISQGCIELAAQHGVEVQGEYFFY